MKKTIRTITYATIITVSLMLAFVILLPPVHAEDRGEFYPKLAVVFDTDQIGNARVIFCVDKAQNVWSFYDDENEWEIGDIANLLMWKLNENDEDDEIVEVYWEGYTEEPENLWGNLEWRQ